MFTNQKRYTSALVTTSIWSLVIFSMVATGASSAFAQDCVRDPAWTCDGDVDGDGQVNPVDVGLVRAAFGGTEDWQLCQYDMDCDGTINPVDAGIVQSMFGTCEEPRAVCGDEGPSLDDLFFFGVDRDVEEFVTIDDQALLAVIVVGNVNRSHTIRWSTGNENVSVDPPETEVFFEERGDVFVLTFTVHSGQDEAFTLTGDVVGPDWQGAVRQDVALFLEGEGNCTVIFELTTVDKDRNVVPWGGGAYSENPEEFEEKTEDLTGGRTMETRLEDDGKGHLIVSTKISDEDTTDIHTIGCDAKENCNQDGDACEPVVVIIDPDNNRRTKNSIGTITCACPA